MSFQTQYTNFDDFVKYREDNFQPIDLKFLDFFVSTKDDVDFKKSVTMNDTDVDNDIDTSEPSIEGNNLSDFLEILKEEMDNSDNESDDKEEIIQHPDAVKQRRKAYVAKEINQTVSVDDQDTHENTETNTSIDSDDLEYSVPYKISSGFGHRKAPDTGGGTHGSTDHKGIDIACPEGTSLSVPMDGIVEKVAYQGPHNGIAGAGNYISIKLKNGKYLVLMHLKELPNLVAGDRVTAGQQVGISGKTGSSGMGAHVHVGYSSTGYSSGHMNWEKCPNSILNKLFK